MTLALIRHSDVQPKVCPFFIDSILSVYLSLIAFQVGLRGPVLLYRKMRVRQAIKALEIIWEKERRRLAGVLLPRDVLGLICKSLQSSAAESCWGAPQISDRWGSALISDRYPAPAPSPHKNLKWKGLGVAVILGAMYLVINSLVMF